MLDINANIQKEQATDTEPKEVPRPRPPLEMPKIEPEGNYLTFFSVIAAILVLLAAVGIYVLKSTRDSALKTKEAEMQSLTGQLMTSPLNSLDKQITDMQNGLQAYKTAISGQMLWSKVFAELEKIDAKNVQFTAFSSDEKNAIKLTGEASDFVSIAKFIRSLENSKEFSDTQLISSTLSNTQEAAGSITFALSFNLKKNANITETNTGSSGTETTPIQ